MMDEISPRRLILSGPRSLKMVRGEECRSYGVLGLAGGSDGWVAGGDRKRW